MFARTNLFALLFFVFACALGAVVGCGERPVAVVNNQRVTETEFMSRLKEVFGKQVLAEMIDRQVIEDAFDKAGLELAEEEIGAELQKMQADFPSRDAFVQYLDSRGITAQELRDKLELNMKVEMLATKDIPVTDEKLMAYYEQHKARYDKPLRVTLKELVTISNKHAEEAGAALQQEGASFSNVVSQYSIVPSRQYGGQRRETAIKELYPMELREAARTTPVGEVVGPIETDGGWYIILIEDRKAAEKATFESAKPQVTKEYKRANASPMDKLLKQLREQAVVKIVIPEFQELSELYAGPQELPEFGEESEQPESLVPETAPSAAPAPSAPPTEEPETPQPTESEGD